MLPHKELQMKTSAKSPPSKHTQNLLVAVCLAIKAVAASAENAYPIVDPRFTVAHPRHAAENFYGSTGVINKWVGISNAELAPYRVDGGTLGVLRFTWQFKSSDPEEFAGPFLAFRRPSLETAKPDGSPGAVVSLPPNVALNLRRFETTSSIPRTIESLRIVLATNSASVKCRPRVELRDSSRRIGATRILFDPAAGAVQTFDLPLSRFPGINRSRVTQMALVIEERHISDRIVNPMAGGFDIRKIEFIDKDGADHSAASIAALPDTEFVEQVARREFETLWRLADPKTGFCWDRTLFPDLIHAGSTGFLLASLPYAVERGWVSRAQAEGRALRILRWADKARLYHDLPSGAIGNSAGLMYRFLGYRGATHRDTGTRKLDRGDTNAVEASLIDTGIFHYGTALCSSGFSANTSAQREIRRLAQSILNRVDWTKLVEPVSGQLYVGWKPESDTTAPGFFATPAAGGGFWASHDAAGTRPLTADYFSAEYQIASIIAVGSQTHSVSPSVWYRTLRPVKLAGGETVVASFPGSSFTSLFAVGLLPSSLGADRAPEWDAAASAVDWFANMQATFRAHRALSPAGTVVLPDPCEFANTSYQAQGRPEIAVDAAATYNGTITPWSLEMAAGLGGADATAAIGELKRLLNSQPGLWHPLWGLADAYHPNLATFSGTGLSRNDAPWIQSQKFSINAGAGLIGMLNFLTNGGIANRAATNPVIASGIDRIFRQPGPLAK